MGVERYYVAENNPDGASFPGVPLRDIEDAEWDNYPAWLQRSVDASSFYRKTPIRKQGQVETARESSNAGGSQ